MHWLFDPGLPPILRNLLRNIGKDECHVVFTASWSLPQLMPLGDKHMSRIGSTLVNGMDSNPLEVVGFQVLTEGVHKEDWFKRPSNNRLPSSTYCNSLELGSNLALSSVVERTLVKQGKL